MDGDTDCSFCCCFCFCIHFLKHVLNPVALSILTSKMLHAACSPVTWTTATASHMVTPLPSNPSCVLSTQQPGRSSKTAAWMWDPPAPWLSMASCCPGVTCKALQDFTSLSWFLGDSTPLAPVPLLVLSSPPRSSWAHPKGLASSGRPALTPRIGSEVLIMHCHSSACFSFVGFLTTGVKRLPGHLF